MLRCPRRAGSNGKLEQKGFALPADATWDAVGSFYDGKLKDMGFAPGTPGGSTANSIVSSALGMANQANPLFKMNMYSKDKQTLTIMMLTDPNTESQKTLIMSLNSN